IFLSLFLVDINFFGILFWPGVDGGRNTSSILTAHMLVVLAGGIFSALAIAAIHGLIAVLFRGHLYQRVSVAVQTLLMFVLVMLLFLTPVIAFSIEHFVRQNHRFVYWFPGSWFIGLYELIRPATKDAILAGLGNRAIP